MISNLPDGYTHEKVADMLKSFPGVEEINMSSASQVLVKFEENNNAQLALASKTYSIKLIFRLK